MPLNSIPATTDVAALRQKIDAARAKCHVDVAFWGGVVPGNAGELEALVDAGVRGFKCFLVPSGADEFPAVTETDLRAALPILARRGVPLLVHAESPRLIGDRGPQTAAESRQLYAHYLATRPPEAELDAVRLMIRLAEEFRTHVHIVHVSAAESVEAIAAAKAAWVPITAETCPHYLTFAAGDIPDGATEFKCAPPIREARHRDALWEGLASGALDLIATDHSPSPPSLKRPGGAGDFMAAWGGIASLELSLAAVCTAYAAHGIPPSLASPDGRGAGASGLASVSSFARWMSAAPAALAGLGERK